MTLASFYFACDLSDYSFVVICGFPWEPDYLVSFSVFPFSQDDRGQSHFVLDQAQQSLGKGDRKTVQRPRSKIEDCDQYRLGVQSFLGLKSSVGLPTKQTLWMRPNSRCALIYPEIFGAD
jgi:hypothetical protein